MHQRLLGGQYGSPTMSPTTPNAIGLHGELD
jgi:hypothetical protein